MIITNILYPVLCLIYIDMFVMIGRITYVWYSERGAFEFYKDDPIGAIYFEKNNLSNIIVELFLLGPYYKIMILTAMYALVYTYGI